MLLCCFLVVVARLWCCMFFNHWSIRVFFYYDGFYYYHLLFSDFLGFNTAKFYSCLVYFVSIVYYYYSYYYFLHLFKLCIAVNYAEQYRDLLPCSPSVLPPYLLCTLVFVAVKVDGGGGLWCEIVRRDSEVRWDTKNISRNVYLYRRAWFNFKPCTF